MDMSSNNIGELVLPEGWTEKKGGWRGRETIGYKHTDGREQKDHPGKPEGSIAIADAISANGALASLNMSNNKMLTADDFDLNAKLGPSEQLQDEIDREVEEMIGMQNAKKWFSDLKKKVKLVERTGDRSVLKMCLNIVITGNPAPLSGIAPRPSAQKLSVPPPCPMPIAWEGRMVPSRMLGL